MGVGSDGTHHGFSQTAFLQPSGLHTQESGVATEEAYEMVPQGLIKRFSANENHRHKPFLAKSDTASLNDH